MLTQIKFFHVVFVIHNLLLYPLKSKFIASPLKVLICSCCLGM